MEKLDYFKKLSTKDLFRDLEWNIPEQKTGTINLIGGNSASFSTVVHTAECLSTFPIKNINLLLPDALKTKLPPLPGAIFLPSTESGSIKSSSALTTALATADFNVFLGDLSKNSETSIAISTAIKNTPGNILLTRDAIDLVLPEMPSIIEHPNLFIVGSAAQIQKLFRAVYYPKVILLSMPLLPFVEALHKFTLSYETTILTFHQEQIIVASLGKVIAVSIDQTSYTPLSLWNGILAAKIAANNLFSAGKPLEATAYSIA